MEEILSGKKFNRLTAMTEHRIKGKKTKWECRCDCGNVVMVDQYKLRSGHTRSCGCLQRERTGETSRGHGMSKTDIYHVWSTMRSRCLNNLRSNYARYGGRGITVCEEWLKFEPFYKDMGDSYSKGLQLDRIDNDKGYCKENCKWSTPIEQSNNRRSSRIVTFKGITDTVPNLCRRFNLNYARVGRRLIDGWTVEDAFSKPTQVNQFN